MMLRKRRGVALIMVLWTIALLAGIVATASSGARSSANVASAVRAGSIAGAMAESGIVAASAEIDTQLRALAGDSLARDRFLTSIVQDGEPFVSDSLGDGVFATVVVDVSARLDANAAGAEGWYLLLRNFTNDGEARRTADAVGAYVQGSTPRFGSDAARAADESRARDSLVAALLGRTAGTATSGTRRTIESLDDLLDVPGVDARLLERIAPFVTVDGNGTINRRAASPQVLAAASGSLVDSPARLLIVSRGWMSGHALTREIQAVYDVSSDGLRLVRWREQER